MASDAGDARQGIADGPGAAAEIVPMVSVVIPTYNEAGGGSGEGNAHGA